MTTVPRGYFCNVMANCILETVSETVKSNMAAGSALMGILPTAVVLLAGTMEDVLSVARRDPYFAFIMSFTTGGAKGMLRSGRPAEVDAGSWSAEIQLTPRSVNAIILPGLINAPFDSEIKINFIRKELSLLHLKQPRFGEGSSRQRQCASMLAWLLRSTSFAATVMLLWLYYLRQDTCYVAFHCPPGLLINLLVAPAAPIVEYLAASHLEYREYWTIKDQSLICYTTSRAPLAGRGVLGGPWSQSKEEMSYWQNIMPSLLTKEPICALVWKRRGLSAEIGRTFIMFISAGTYLFATAFFSSIVLMPAMQATQIFMASLGVLMYNRMVLIVLDALPGGIMSPIQEVTIR
ncbi:hypothetical protein OPT61_g3526 [Boeremia exigua]|uniref:Uncharacterized protein n=1 Tax=Boeremia exigua TaxID=749465 RepID=A0ACC2IHH4_9PLEO|nr:hypothetical protein OPT61_g3526 [Boeremia exigua]